LFFVACLFVCLTSHGCSCTSSRYASYSPISTELSIFPFFASSIHYSTHYLNCSHTLYNYRWFARVGRYQKFLLPSVGDMGPGDTQFQKYFSWQGTVDSSNYASVRCSPTLLAQSLHQCDQYFRCESACTHQWLLCFR
jgi:hypothetical protein